MVNSISEALTNETVDAVNNLHAETKKQLKQDCERISSTIQNLIEHTDGNPDDAEIILALTHKLKIAEDFKNDFI